MGLTNIAINLLADGLLFIDAVRNREHIAIERRLQGIWESCRVASVNGTEVLFPKVLGIKKLRYGIAVRLHLPSGLCPDDLRKCIPELSWAFNGDAAMWVMGKSVVLQIHQGKLPTRIAYKPSLMKRLRSLPFALPIGLSRAGYEVLQLSSGFCHLLVGGMPGTGKSVFLRQVIAGIHASRTPTEVRLYLTDRKYGLEFKLFKGSPFVSDIAGTYEEATEQLITLNKLMDSQAGVLVNSKYSNIIQYNNAHPDNILPYVVCVIDEFAELDKVQKKLVDRIGRMGRAPGVHLVVCTQRPDADTVPGVIKANLSATVAFKVRDQINSRILLDNDMAAAIAPIPGRAIFQAKHTREVQVPWLSESACRRLVRNSISVYGEMHTETVCEPLPY